MRCEGCALGEDSVVNSSVNVSETPTLTLGYVDIA